MKSGNVTMIVRMIRREYIVSSSSSGSFYLSPFILSAMENLNVCEPNQLQVIEEETNGDENKGNKISTMSETSKRKKNIRKQIFTNNGKRMI